MQSQSSGSFHSYLTPVNHGMVEPSYERVLPSIEHQEDASGHPPHAAPHHQAPRTPTHQYANKRPKTNYSPNHLYPTAGDPYRSNYSQPSHLSQPRYAQAPQHEVIDLTGSDQRSPAGRPSPMKDIRTASVGYAQDERAFGGNVPREHPSVPPYANHRSPYREHQQREPEPYDPTQPLLHLPEEQPLQNAYPAPIRSDRERYPGVAQAMPPAHSGSMPYHAAPSNTYYGQPVPFNEPPRQDLYQQPQLRYLSVPASAPRPIHGAPAPVQQVPLEGKNARLPTGSYMQSQQGQIFSQQALPPTAPPPTNGAPHPAQYYYPR